MDTQPRTLYDDWKTRRDRLASASGETADYRAVELRILDYLLRRYHGSPEAERPARFPLSKDLCIDYRAIIVHHHLGRGVIPNISSQEEAIARVRALVERMQSPPPAGAVDVPDDAPPSFTLPTQPDAVEAARTRLCDRDPVIRILAALELGETGTLDDVGLLSDLLSLPAGSEEHPRQREALLHAMKRLSGTTEEPFDLSGVLPPREYSMCVGRTRASIKRHPRSPAESYLFCFLAALAVLMLLGTGITLILDWLGGP